MKHKIVSYSIPEIVHELILFSKTAQVDTTFHTYVKSLLCKR